MDIKKILQKIKNWKTVSILLVLMFFLNLLLVNYFFLEPELKKNPISLLKTYKTTGKCFFRKSEKNKWQFLSGEEILTSGTQIQTDEDSSTVFSFLNQTGRIETSGKSHFSIQEASDGVLIDFIRGEVFVNYQTTDLQKALFVKIGERYLKLTNSDIFLWGDAGDQVVLTVDYGKIHMSAGEHTNVFENGQLIHFKNEREYLVEESPFKISTPLNYEKLNITGEKLRVRFAYAPIGKEYKVQLFLGEDIFNLKPQFKKPIKIKGSEFNLPLEKGQYYWRLGAYKENEIKLSFRSHIKKFFVEPQIAIQPTYPLAAAQVPIKNKKASVKFEWANPSQLEKTFLEISDKKDFSNLILHEVVDQNNYFNYVFNKEGTYYWRVSGFPFGTSEVLNGVQRSIKILGENAARKIDIFFPKNLSQLTQQSLYYSDIQFEWESKLGVSKYKITIQKEEDQSRFEFISEVNSIKINDLPEGNYKWKVEDANRFDVSSSYESFRVIETEKIKVIEQDEKDLLSWEPGPKGTSEYRVEVLRIGSKSNFNDFFNENSNRKSKLTVKSEKMSYKNFSDGVYVFKIYALNSKNKIIADSQLKFLRVSSSLR